MENRQRHYHSLECRGHFRGNKTMAKVLQSGFFSQLYTRMLMPLCLLMLDVRGWGICPEETSCH